MVEKLYNFALEKGEKLIERVISDNNADINHAVLPNGECLPEHYSNSHVYLIVVKGTITLQLNDENSRSYPTGSIVNIPYKTKMNVSNAHSEVLEFFIVKAPSPKSFK
jgi:quercetin dioxygenase-like cupin family protein